MSSNAIIVKNIEKIYKLYSHPVDRLKESLHPLRKKYHTDFYALRRVSLQINAGETVGVIGKNGSGKSTLLKIITGVLTPTAGTVETNGKISALLELGAGFNPDFTGRENIYFNGSIMGYSRDEMNAKIDDIISFADIGEFIDQPVKVYSSGMFARLAFSLAITVDPDVLITDEILSVGDMFFQEKAISRMKEFRKKNRTVIYVSHALASVRNFCERAIWIDSGAIVMDGPSDVVCEKYKEFMMEREINISDKTEGVVDFASYKMFVREISADKNEYYTGENITIDIHLGFNVDVDAYGVGIIIFNKKGKIVTLFNTVRDDIVLKEKKDSIKLVIPDNDFLSGEYYVTVAISDEKCMFPYFKDEYCLSFKVNDLKNWFGLPIAEGFFRSKHQWVY